MCVAGARWVQQEILEKRPDANLRVYAIWFPMIESDSMARWPRGILTDPRASNMWDEDRILGRWYARHLELDGWTRVLWDAYLLYGPEARWGSEPRPLVAWGHTIVETREEMRAKVAGLLRESTREEPER